MEQHLIAVMGGDGIGPEVTAAAQAVLEATGELFGLPLKFESGLVGGASVDKHGVPIPPESQELALRSAAVLFGAAGGPQWANVKREQQPELGLLWLRQNLNTFANLRPVRPIGKSADNSPIKADRLAGVDLLVVRELSGGVYFGEKHRDETSASDVCSYTVVQIERIVRKACQLAQGRKRKVTSVDKQNVLETSRLWRATATRVVAEEFPDIALEHLLVDAMAMHLLSRPADFDVIVTENMFGDILTDEASMLSGSLGMLPSASLGDGPGLYEPIHGSAPDIAGKNLANPFGAILSAAMLLDFSLEQPDAARVIEKAVEQTIDAGIVTGDLCQGDGASTTEVRDAVLARLK